ncbi:hypothetical protein K501DRAFT_328432 [Backusella circina FSU 941]|nr:hypothetical protein K501DRAFT_328432 [Backusella circina FSU 941]
MNITDFLLKPTMVSQPSIQLTTCNAHAHIEEKRSQSASTFSRPTLQKNNVSEWSRTQQKLMLQRQSFLADDKNYLEHPDNMRRLTKELDRVNREYRCVRQFEDPLALSFKRLTASDHIPTLASTNTSAASSWSSSSSSLFNVAPRLQRRASSHTVQDYLLNFKEERRHSFTSPDRSQGYIGRLFGSTVHHTPPSSSQLKRHQY